MAGLKKLHDQYNRVFGDKSNSENLTVPCSFYVVFLSGFFFVCFGFLVFFCFVLFCCCFNDHVTLASYILFCCPVSQLLSPEFSPLRGVQRTSPKIPH